MKHYKFLDRLGRELGKAYGTGPFDAKVRAGLNYVECTAIFIGMAQIATTS